MAELHPRLQADCHVVGRFPLCHLLVMNDANYPWCILVPDRPDITEIYQLTDDDQQQLLRESSYLAEAMAIMFNADKMNIAALGNMVPQLHVHHIVRYKTDPAWPAPVWGRQAARPYTEGELLQLITLLKTTLPDVVTG
ncbi:MAG: hypothetical protein A2V90_03890 [Gammaproteobacteria bacterium RBG_16_57_12]|nr:MAG: hypothetical protein A2V90_03890 [Gammaproteobacteria bacterium RBG_16_57_12]